MKHSEADPKNYHSKYYPFAPLHNERPLLNITGRYKDCLDTLFGKYSNDDKPLHFGVLDYLTLGILPLLRNWSTLKFLYRCSKTLKKILAYFLAIPLMLVVIVFKPLLTLFLEVFLNILNLVI